MTKAGAIQVVPQGLHDEWPPGALPGTRGQPRPGWGYHLLLMQMLLRLCQAVHCLEPWKVLLNLHLKLQRSFAVEHQLEKRRIKKKSRLTCRQLENIT